MDPKNIDLKKSLNESCAAGAELRTAGHRMFAAGKLRRLVPLSLLLSAAGVLATQYFFNIDFPEVTRRIKLHREVIDGIAENPYRYRILAPLMTEGLYSCLVPLFGDSRRELAFLASYALFDIVTIAAGLYTLYLFLREFFTVDQSLIGSLFAAVTMALTFRDHYFHPWSLLEMPLFNTGLLLMHRRRFSWLLPLIVLAALNRETSAFLAFAFLFTMVVDASTAGRFALLSLTWLAVFLGLRYFRGYVPPSFTIHTAWINNTVPGSCEWSSS